MRFGILAIGLIAFAPNAQAQSLSQRIDQAIQANYKGPFAKPASDAEFLRRASLDFTGAIPTTDEVRAYLKDTATDRQTKLIDRLLKSPDFPRRMADAYTVMFEERRDTKEVPGAAWDQFLLESFAKNRPWNELVRDILAANPDEPSQRAASKFYLDRDGDLHLITKDVGRLFLGRDIECARCHDHPVVRDYSQKDYFGLYAYLNRSFQFKRKTGETVFAEKVGPGKVDFESVFTMEKGATFASLPGGKEIMEPDFPKGEEYVEKPDPKKGVAGIPKFSPRAELAKSITEPTKSLFARNAANRFWFLMMGRGVVHPLDLHHSANPPSNPKLLDVLTEGLIEMKYDVPKFLGAIAKTEAYRRSSRLPKKDAEIAPGAFAVPELRSLSPEQLHASIARATDYFDQAFAKLEADKKSDPIARAQAYRTAFANPTKLFVVAFGSRAGEAETEFQPSLHGALFMLNESSIQNMIKQVVTTKIEKLPNDDAMIEEIYLRVLSRRPEAVEVTEAHEHLKRRGDQRSLALQELAWALVASTEFRLNH